MFIVPLCYESDVPGVIISPLNGLMDEQVDHEMCVDKRQALPQSTFYLSQKVAKLSSMGVKGVRVVSSDKDVYSCVLSGNYRFGTRIHMIW